LNITPVLHEISTPEISEVEIGESDNCETPILHHISTPVLSEEGIWESENGEESICSSGEDINLNGTLLSQKYMSEDFLDKNGIDHQEVSQVIRQIRVKNMNRVIIGHLNINFMAPKLDAIRTIIPGNVDIMVFSETKLDDSYPTTQLLIEGFRKPFRLERNTRVGGGLLIYVRSDIPCKQLSKHDFPDGIEGIFIEINFRKSKWLLFGTYHPHLARMTTFILIVLGSALMFILKVMIRFY